MSNLLTLKGIGKIFPGVVALSDMHFSLNSGEVHAICGENGAGKSTLMKIISGVYQADSGEILINGKARKFENPLEALDNGIAVIYQETSLFEEMTVLENLFLCHERQKKILGFIPVIDYKTMRDEVQDTFASLNTRINLDSRIKDLGMAQKQMVEVAKALTYHSRILILDEPTASLTQREVDALFEVVRRLRAAGVGIVYISHRLEEIFELCDRVTVIRDGQYISTKIVTETDTDQLVADMVGRAVSCYYPKADSSIGDMLFEAKGVSVPGLLHDLSFNVRKNEIVGFAGLAGSGRTEMAQAICGFLKRSAGDLYLDGKKLKVNEYRDAKEAGIVYVSEDRAKYGLIVDMSVCHNISMPQLDKVSRSGFIDFAEESRLAKEYIRKVGIKAPDENFLVANLSGGNQQKVSVSKALALNPQLLILDEPTRGVDVGAKAEIHKLISDLTLEDLSIIMISSELSELLCMCDRIYVMSEGRIVACFDQKDATQEKILKIALEQVS